jgi:hypothetical protein
MEFGLKGTGNSYNNQYYSKNQPSDNSNSSSNDNNKVKSQTQEKDSIRIRLEKQMGLRECESCKSRKYQDGSSDASVSFKSPGHISPEASAGTVMSHEMEHVSNETAKAKEEGRKVVSQNVSLETSVCPECGKVYVSGGKTTTVTKSDTQSTRKDYFSDNYNKIMSGYFGKSLDVKV